MLPNILRLAESTAPTCALPNGDGFRGLKMSLLWNFLNRLCFMAGVGNTPKHLEKLISDN